MLEDKNLENKTTDKSTDGSFGGHRAPMASMNLDFKEIINLVYARWYWFVISLAVALGLAALYLMSAEYRYVATARVMLLTEDDAQKSSVDLSALGIGRENANILNEVFRLESPVLMEEVVKRLGINNRYSTKDGLRTVELYKTTPVMVVPADTLTLKNYRFNIKLDGNGGFTLSDFSKGDSDVTVSGKLGQTVNTPIGPFSVMRSPWYSSSKYKDSEITFTHCPPADLSNGYFNISAYPDFERATVLTLTVKDISPIRAVDVTRTLLEVYDDYMKEEQSRASKSTTEFIDNRLAILNADLGEVEGAISSFKSSNLMPDVKMASSLYFGEAFHNKNSMLNLNSQIAMAQYVRRELMDDNIDNILPMGPGFDANGVGQQINEYNRLVLERNRLMTSGNENNPSLIDATNTLKVLKKNMVRSLDNVITSLNNQLANLNTTESKANSELAANPDREKYLLQVEREQKVKEQLYMFLLQKREEAELTQAYTKENMMVLAEPSGSSEPETPKKLNILLIALAAGLVFPLVIIILNETLNTTVRGRRDLGMTSIPFVGEIPFGPGRPKRVPFLSKPRSASSRDVVVKEGANNVINEAFRAIRTSLEFMTPDNKGEGRLISFTSACSGSGKTFIVMNLAMALALSGKKVLCVDLDMRKASLSKWGGRTDKGLSNYLIGQLSLSDIIEHDINGNPNIDLLPVGIIPPNPVELLSHKRVKELFEELRKDYDYVLVDCPPAEIVADARIISSYMDMTLFIIRSGMFERAMVEELTEYAETNRYHNLAIILNGTDPNSLYRRKRYGYAYGYGYGYVKK